MHTHISHPHRILGAILAVITVVPLSAYIAMVGMSDIQASTLQRFDTIYSQRSSLRLDTRAFRKAMEDYEIGVLSERPSLNNPETYQQYLTDAGSDLRPSAHNEASLGLSVRQKAIIDRYITATGGCPTALRSRGLFLLCRQLLAARQSDTDQENVITGLLNPKAYWNSQRDVLPNTLRNRIRQVQSLDTSRKTQRSIRRTAPKSYYNEDASDES